MSARLLAAALVSIAVSAPAPVLAVTVRVMKGSAIGMPSTFTRALLSELGARRTDGDIVVDLPADVLFDFDKATIRPDAEPALRKASELLRGYPAATVMIGGHTDAKGDDAYNDALSLRRAKAVAERLSQGSSVRLEAKGFGEREPVAANQRPDGSDDPQGRQKNRRVEIRITPRAA